jgi:ERCC4-type nuclease
MIVIFVYTLFFIQAEAMTRHYKKAVLLIEQEQQAQSVAAGMRYRNGIQTEFGILSN